MSPDLRHYSLFLITTYLPLVVLVLLISSFFPFFDDYLSSFLSPPSENSS